jgi:hypothetical protein
MIGEVDDFCVVEMGEAAWVWAWIDEDDVDSEM